MATFSGTYTLDMSVLANYTSLMGDIFSQITAMGWVQTADTGQTDPGGVGALPAQNNYGNFAVFRTNDGLTNVYFRLGFGRNSANQPSFTFQIGTGTDGAGTLNGNTTSLQTGYAGNTSSGKLLYISGSTSRIAIVLNTVDGRDQQFTCVVARSVDTGGAYTATTATMFWRYSGTLAGQHTIGFGGTNGIEQKFLRAAVPQPATGTTWVVGTDVAAAWCVPMGPGYNANPSIDVGVVRNGDFTANTTTAITHYGASHTYLVTGVDECTGTLTTGNTDTMLVRYE